MVLVYFVRFRVCESEFVDLTPNKPEKVGDVPSAAAAVMPGASRKVPYTIHVSLRNSKTFTLKSFVVYCVVRHFLVQHLFSAVSL